MHGTSRQRWAWRGGAVVVVCVPLVATALFALVRVPHARSAWRDGWRARLEELARDRERSLERSLADARADAAVVANDRTVVSLLSGRPAGIGAAESTEALARELERNHREHGYHGFWLLDPSGRVVLASAPAHAVAGEAGVAARAVLERGQWTALHADADGSTDVSVAGPVADPDGRIVGVVLLEAPADRLLLDALSIGSLRVPSAEAYLAQRDGDDVLFFSPVRNGARPLALRRPLSDAPFARRALAGLSSFTDGRDHGGVRALGTTRRVDPPGWGLVVSVSRSEALAELLTELLVEGVGLGLALAAVIVPGTWLLRRASRENERQVRTIAEVLPQIVFSADRAGRTDYLNQRWEETTGLPLRVGLVSGWAGAVHPEDWETTVREWRAAVTSGEPFETLCRLRVSSGGHRWMLARAVALRSGGQAVRWFGSLTDVDDAHRLQQELAGARVRLEARVLERTAELERASARLAALGRRVVEVQESERRAVARELHDEAGQAMTALLIALGVLERRCAENDGAVGQIHELKAMVNAVMCSLHELAVRLRPASLDRLGVVAALRQLAQGARRDGLRVEFEAVGLDGRRLPEEVESTAYRVVQEALTNVRRHAGATQVAVVLSCRGARLVGVVEDDGGGFDVEEARSRGRLGLEGMAERVELVGGELEIESAPGAGTTVRFELPLDAPLARPPEAAGSEPTRLENATL